MRSLLPSLLLVLISAPAARSDGDLLAKYNDTLKAEPHSSITHFRLAEIYFQRGNFQTAANEFRAALNGDLQPKWIEVWCHLNLGKIFDAMNQRSRALNEYKQAERTGDNTRGAVDEAQLYTEFPYPPPK
jgi:tetratricopeptide (TPR) repeat protein